MLSRDGEADRYPRRGPDDPGAPFFDGTMEHAVSSTPTDATRRNPGTLSPYYRRQLDRKEEVCCWRLLDPIRESQTGVPAAIAARTVPRPMRSVRLPGPTEPTRKDSDHETVHHDASHCRWSDAGKRRRVG